jgi:raffinose/stachyose/melibiose transport system substrate-binding protein
VKRSHRLRPRCAVALVSVAALALVAVAAAAPTSTHSARTTKISMATTNSPNDLIPLQALVNVFNKAHPKIKVSLDPHPGGTDGDNLVKTRLATGSMDDFFAYNAGSLFQQLSPAKYLRPLTKEPFMKNVDPAFFPVVSVGKTVYGVPGGSTMAGGVIYNIPLYKKLGLSIPKTWDEFIANSQKIKAQAPGVAPVVQTYKDTWTSQLLVLADYANIAAHEPNFATQYTHNQKKFATDKYAIGGFQHLEQLHKLGLLNADFASATLNDGLKMVATGTGAQYPMLTAVIGALKQVAPNNVKDVGYFALPGVGPAKPRATIWLPGAFYVPKTTKGDHLTAVETFLAFIATKRACDTFSTASPPTGPYVIKGCTLPTSLPPMTKDLQPYIAAHLTAPALEFLSPIKGPNLEQICVAVGSGITSAQDGAAQYDQDVKKQAQQLGLPGW